MGKRRSEGHPAKRPRPDDPPPGQYGRRGSRIYAGARPGVYMWSRALINWLLDGCPDPEPDPFVLGDPDRPIWPPLDFDAFCDLFEVVLEERKARDA